jgi:hypothetical protein
MIKRHSYDIFKLYLNQIGITVFSFILITALGSISSSVAMQVGISVFTTLFFSVLIYTVAWDLGAKDRLSTDAGREKPFIFKGAVLSVLANVPNFVFAGLGAIFFLVSMGGHPAFYSAGVVFLTIAKFTMTIYLGIVETAVTFSTHWGTMDGVVTSLGYFIVPAIAIFVTQLGYYLGFKEKKLFGKLFDTKR